VRRSHCGHELYAAQGADLQSFWRNVVNKVHAITDVPAERFNVDCFFDPDRRGRDKIYSRWGDSWKMRVRSHALRDSAERAVFDRPMQLLALVVVDRALADAGYRDRDFPRDKIRLSSASAEVWAT